MTATAPSDTASRSPEGAAPLSPSGSAAGRTAAPRASRPTRRERGDDATDRGILSWADRSRRRIRWTTNSLHGVLLIAVVIAGLLPLLWLGKAALTDTQDTLRTPMALFPHGIDWQNIVTAWSTVGIGAQFANTLWVALGSWAVQLLVATTAGYVLSVLRPRYAPVLNALVLGTLFVPAVVLLVPLYLTILHPPVIGTSMMNTYWAVWLPAGANAFNVLLVKRFFDNLPREVFEAARTDGAGPVRLFWSIVLPMSKPILGVVSVFAVINAWKDYLWPMLVLRDPGVQPLSVRLPQLQSAIQLDVYLAALAISTLIPIVLFLAFQGMFLRNAGLGGAVKG
ncbi:carbohydrate ABC transporter permease [Curtobacterium sp. ISL-83]|uniref:carbohydrate ABC transporter permease n=1 Tax=Curtobacterium sp. ISL-83 TaxID=2819145 RepID=UPI0035ABC9BE